MERARAGAYDPALLDPRPILVTGGSGFLGRHVVRAWARRGRAVVALDVSEPRSGELPETARFVRGDVRDERLVDELVAGASLVVHLAAVVGVDEYLARPDEVLDVGVIGTRTVLHACVRHARPVVLASTSEAYGKNDADLDEDADTVLGPTSRARWSYAVSKLASEHWAHALARRGLRHVTVRYFNVYGAGLDSPGSGRVLAKMIGAIQRGEPLRLVDGGEAVRSFCHVDDAVEATVRLGESIERDDRLRGRTFNVGRREPVTIRELGETVARLAAHAPGCATIASGDEFGAGFEEIPHRVPDVQAIREAVGFVAEISLEEGLRRTLAAHGLLAPERERRAAPLPPIPWVRPDFAPDGALLARIRGSLASGRVTNGGPLVRRFEGGAAAWLGVDDAVAVSNGTDALTVAALALGLRGRFVLPAFTYAATLSALELLGLAPVFCDVDAETWTLSPERLAETLAREGPVAAVVAVNAYGVPPDLAALADVCRAHGAKLVYDDAHGFGTVAHGLRVPREPDVVTFSLHATKAMPAVEGGLVVARDPAVLAEARRIRAHGLAADPLASTPGPNAKMDELRAAVGLHSLARFDDALARRRAHGERLRARALAHAPALRVQRVPDGVTSNHQNFTLVLDAEPAPDPVAAAARLAADGIETRRYFYPALHQLRRFDGTRPSLLVTERLVARLLSLPLHARMSDAELERVERAIDALGHLGAEPR